jgi:hypothetical protein
VSLQLSRFEQDFNQYDVTHPAQSDQKLTLKYGAFYQDYITGIMGFGRSDSKLDTTTHDPHEEIARFLASANDRALYDTVQQRYSDLAPAMQQLSTALKHFKYYFPQQPQPTRVYTFISEFGNGAITYSDTILGIGLDMYLGEHYRYYESVGFPQYMRRKLSREYIVPNAMEVLYNLHYDKQAYNAELPMIEAMINEGKRYYYLECMLPTAPDSLIMGYTREQAAWCIASEKAVWQYFNEKDLLYKVNYMEQKRYTSDGPTTNGMPPEAPAKVGSWVGWQIVRRFMKNSKGKITLAELLQKYSAKQIFTMANYKPR